MEGRIHSVETMGTLDGPGLRTVFFLQGCNMKCVYCHNRDTWDLSEGESWSAERIVSTALSYRDYYGEEGGVTFSGGEPLLQVDFLLEAVKELKDAGIHTAVDTSGSVFNEKTRKLFNMADLVLLDIKHSDISQYPRICGNRGKNTFSNLRYLQENTTAYWVRQVIVEGYTDSVSQVEELATLLKPGHRPRRVDLLPYHEMGKEKWKLYGEDYPLEGTAPPSEERMSLLRDRLTVTGFNK